MLLLEQLCFTCVAQNMTIKTPLLCAYFFGKKTWHNPLNANVVQCFLLAKWAHYCILFSKCFKTIPAKRSEQIAGRCRRSFREVLGKITFCFLWMPCKWCALFSSSFWTPEGGMLVSGGKQWCWELSFCFFRTEPKKLKKIKREEKRSWLLEPSFLEFEFAFNLNCYFCESIIQLKPKSRSGRKRIKQIYFHSSAKLSFCFFFQFFRISFLQIAQSWLATVGFSSWASSEHWTLWWNVNINKVNIKTLSCYQHLSPIRSRLAFLRSEFISEPQGV